MARHPHYDGASLVCNAPQHKATQRAESAPKFNKLNKLARSLNRREVRVTFSKRTHIITL